MIFLWKCKIIAPLLQFRSEEYKKLYFMMKYILKYFVIFLRSLQPLMTTCLQNSKIKLKPNPRPNRNKKKKSWHYKGCCKLLKTKWKTYRNYLKRYTLPGADAEILKRGVLYVGHHGWPTKKILGFKWSKKAKIMLETKAFGETFLSVFSNFLHFYI